jgi:hypothetical protein
MEEALDGKSLKDLQEQDFQEGHTTHISLEVFTSALKLEMDSHNTN